MKKHLIAFAAAVSLAVPCFAQTAPALDPAVVQAVKEMMSAMKVRDVMASSMQQMQQAMPAAMRSSTAQMINGNPAMSAERKQQALAQFDKEWPKIQAQMLVLFADPTLMDDLMAEMVPLYANNYSVDEIHQMSAFYQSPVGQKMLATTPKLMSEMMAINNRVVIPRIQKLMAQATNSVAGK
jgi:hypothetical protein